MAVTFPGQWAESSTHPGYPAYIDKLPPIEAAFERWWYDEGSAISPESDESHEEHARRVSRIAWCNGAYKAVADEVTLEAL